MTQNRDGPNWETIKAEYICGGISQEKLAAKHGVPVRTLFEHARKEKWTEARKEASRKVAEKLPGKIADIQTNTVARLIRMQSKAALAAYEKILKNIVSFPDGVGTKVTRDTVEVKKITVGDKELEFPLKSGFVNDLEAAVRSMVALAKLYGIDAASQLDKQRFDMDHGQVAPDSDSDAVMEEVRARLETEKVMTLEQGTGDGISVPDRAAGELRPDAGV